ncbi:Transcription factor [Friedmanniomyces endolithicus]|uniref:Transcription factor n=2 Tax=Friedmanniomyces endolithicus TaxID=329885 RepID=A0AAN6FUU9_9PEZI|nr:Transcription factor [Friedmanniomyces endolithicus]KAK0287450.1 Transcription factor [Friedmanniomyces endolithicus]KAK0300257.1 Transcription factor [Friedmanniomyces endolithicus]KAK0314763.1 Transcription factor [Friedmanniomyces endolithicus]KAK0324942.1 Transcription factor [Friedmanniomyces endolithicus]
MASIASHSAANSPRLSGKASMTSSPRTRNTQHVADHTDSRRDPPSPEIKPDPSVPIIKQPEDTRDNVPPTTNAPLAPPPRPTQNSDGDYFGVQTHKSHLSKEPNPFENAFSNPVETPGKGQLPGVSSLTSPASLLPGNTPGWPGSLRSGPLSPAMLTGPTGSNDYFNSDHHFGGSFPTPNESSLRTGLTPGGGGSMFPHPSPNSQAIYNQLQNGGATPGTLDFHRTAMHARAQNQADNFNMTRSGITSQPQGNPNIQPDLDAKPFAQGAQNQQQDPQDPFGSHQTNDAANGLYMLAQAGGQRGAQQTYGMQQQPPQAYQQQQQTQQGMQQEVSKHQRTNKNSIGSTMSGDTDGGQGEFSDGSAETKPTARGGRGKKGSAGKTANGKRKQEDMSTKVNSKKQRGSNGLAMPPMPMTMDDMDDDEEQDMMDQDENGPDGRKMTDEEKRKNFLERNRIAALKCRQRKKQWLQNLQQKVEIFSTENDALAATVTQLREEIVGLKTLLLAHKDCPVSQAQGISGMAMQQIAGDTQHYANPYGMAMGPGGPQQGQMGGPVQRR